MEQFNNYLQRLARLDVDYQAESTFREIEKELQEVAYNYKGPEVDEAIAMGRRPVQPPLYKLTIYYPISRRNDLSPSPATYRSPQPITPADLIESIGAVYRSPLSQENINAYIQISSDYRDLNEPILRSKIMGGPKLRDVINGHPTAFVPYQDGYLLQFSA